MKRNIADLTHLTWSLSRNSSGTAGSFLKAFEEIDGVKYYYKMSNFDTIRGVYGHECVNEKVAENIAELLAIPHLHYDLVHANVCIDNKIYDTWLTKSADFKVTGERKLTFETFYEINHKPDEELWEFIVRQGQQTYFYQLFLLDYIICNRDRHGANVEVLQRKGDYRIAPVFDNGLSLLFSCYNDGTAMEQFDYQKDGPVNNYVGSMSLWENLQKVPLDMLEHTINCVWHESVILKDLDEVLSDENAVPKQYRTCIMKMLTERVNAIEKIFN